ncbi:MAG: GntR family transcriptional regulator [Corynebacteriales bacterium]|nr:GntR family transcriptional regulator [Mycobacteriales bacterium]
MNERVPIYRRIADELRDAIQAGEYVDGDKLPGENAIMKSHSVARATARQALSVLINEGIAMSRKGSGVYVRLFTRVKRQSPERLASQRWQGGHDIHTLDASGRKRAVDSVEVDRVACPDHVAEAFGVPLGSVTLRRKRRYWIDDEPVQLATSYIPLELTENTAIVNVDTGPGGTYARLAEAGYKPVRFVERLVVKMPTPDEVSMLLLVPGTPVILITRFAFSADDRLVEVNDMVLDASSYALEYEFSS